MAIPEGYRTRASVAAEKKLAEKKKALQKPTHEIFGIQEIVDRIADMAADPVHDDEDVTLTGIAAHQKKELQSLRLINRAFAAAAARLLFREWHIEGQTTGNQLIDGPFYRPDTLLSSWHGNNTRRIPANFVRFEQFSNTPLAKHVRVFRIEDADRSSTPWGGTVNTSLTWDIRDVIAPDDPLVRDGDFDTVLADGGITNTQRHYDDLHQLFYSWIASRLKRFSNARHLVVKDWDHALPSIMNIAFASGLPFKSLAMELTACYPTLLCAEEFMTLAIRDVVSRLQGVRWTRPKSTRNIDRSEMDIMVASQLGAIKNLHCLDLYFWPSAYAPRQDRGFSGPCITKHKTLRVLRLHCVQITSEALCNILVSNKDTLQEVRLYNVHLRAGYWHPVLQLLSTMLKTLVSLRLDGLRYCFHGSAMIPLTMPHMQDRQPMGRGFPKTDRMAKLMDIFGPLKTLNSKDRQAYVSLVEKGRWYVGHFAVEYEMDRLGGAGGKAHLIAEYTRCAGVAKTTAGARCRQFRGTKHDETTGVWTYDEVPGMTTDKVWFCRHHIGQAEERSQKWPWEVASTGDVW